MQGSGLNNYMETQEGAYKDYSPFKRLFFEFPCLFGGVYNLISRSIWGFPKIRGTFLGIPNRKIYGILGSTLGSTLSSTLGSLYFVKLPFEIPFEF